MDFTNVGNDNSDKDYDFSNWGLNEKWLMVFNFYAENGLPAFKNYKFKQNFKKLSLWNRIQLSNNLLAGIFGPLYFICLGMWRQALGLCLVLMIIDLLLIVIFGPLSGVVLSVHIALPMYLANPAYYLHRVKKSKSFNVFEGCY
ncbi:MAG: DUF2628 domain-containing protein [Snodgrassella sp.]|nr:DUF2628 domain-containing protein [Snodgrassella sp.]